MKKILSLALPIMVMMCAVSCEEEEQIKQGLIDVTITYRGELERNLQRGTINICPMSQWDLITTFAQQINDSYMDGSWINAAKNLVADLEDSMYRLAGNGFSYDNYHFSEKIDPGSYIVVVIYRVKYNIENCLYGYDVRYKAVNVESDQTTSVAFVFDDHIVY